MPGVSASTTRSSGACWTRATRLRPTGSTRHCGCSGASSSWKSTAASTASAVSFPFGAAAHHAPLRRERPAPISSSGSSAKPGLASQCDPHRANRRDRDSGRNVDLHVVLIEWHLSGAHQRLQHCTQDAYPPNPPSDRSVAACRDDAARSSASAPDPLALHRSRSPLPPVHRPVALNPPKPEARLPSPTRLLARQFARSRDLHRPVVPQTPAATRPTSHSQARDQPCDVPRVALAILSVSMPLSRAWSALARHPFSSGLPASGAK